MSAIHLPVAVEASDDGWFRVFSAGTALVCRAPSLMTANQIATALNLHDELAAALDQRMHEIAGHSLSCTCQNCELWRKAKP